MVAITLLPPVIQPACQATSYAALVRMGIERLRPNGVKQPLKGRQKDDGDEQNESNPAVEVDALRHGRFRLILILGVTT